MANKHAALLALPPPVLQELDNDLRKALPTKVLAERLHAQGYMKDTSAPSLGRELRAYRKDCIAIPEAARVTSIQRSPNPETQALILKKADQWDAHARWMRLIQDAERRYWKMVGPFKDSPLPPDHVKIAARDMHKMYESYTKFLLETGAIRRAPTQHQHIVASMVQISSVEDAGQLIQALSTWLAGNEERIPHYMYANLEHLVNTMSVDALLADLREVAKDYCPTPEQREESARRVQHALRHLHGEEPEPEETEDPEPREQYAITYVEDPDDGRAPLDSPRSTPHAVLEIVGAPERLSD